MNAKINELLRDLTHSGMEICRSIKLDSCQPKRSCGELDGEEVVQLYITDKAASFTRPVKELKGFKKVFIAKGEEKTVELELKISELGFHNRRLEYIVESGEFIISVGTNSDEVLQEEISVK